MTATVISNAAPFGALTNDMVAAIYAVTEAMDRLQSAVATAASGFDGVPGTEYEDGSDYAFAVNTLAGQWATFWDAAKPSIEQLDNGVRNP